MQTEISSMGKWHKILSPCNIKDIFKLKKRSKRNDSHKGNVDRETCVLDKMSEKRNRCSDERAKCPLELIHCDIAGSIKPIVKDGFKYVHSFVDDDSGINLAY